MITSFSEDAEIIALVIVLKAQDLSTLLTWAPRDLATPLMMTIFSSMPSEVPQDTEKQTMDLFSMTMMEMREVHAILLTTNGDAK